ncbi:PRC-barrel domain containing protein [Paraburkholderia sp. NMBU_R16]|uniref:PRC-barrel domain-containing protein n=1 Tax=Paraburkholderia sp. NMBU_R16 TaxID=2698676 RepID=UPI00156317DB|nr:PRC-barrel domain-containing protein [Paraburkholderia sp. NMBU_R16]NRO97018.1 PRC-barrel domain containing protein [Paraburkholderia sp. NMBU_R16]
MKFALAIPTVAMAIVLSSATAHAQGTAQSITANRTDVVQLASGYRASKMLGAPVYDENKNKIGKIDDLIVSPKDSVTYAILSIGGFLGVGRHLIAVPFSDLQIVDKQFRLRGLTSDSLKAMSEFKYATPTP